MLSKREGNYTAGNRNTRCSKAVRKAASEPDERSAPQVVRIFSEGSDSAWVAQLVERVLGKDEVTGSIPVPGSRVELVFHGRRSNAVLSVAAGGGNSTVESHSSKVMVAGSNPVPRSKVPRKPRQSKAV